MLLSDCCMKPVLIEDMGRLEIFRCAHCFRKCFVTDRSKFRLQAIINKMEKYKAEINYKPVRVKPYSEDETELFFMNYEV